MVQCEGKKWMTRVGQGVAPKCFVLWINAGAKVVESVVLRWKKMIEERKSIVKSTISLMGARKSRTQFGFQADDKSS